MQPSDEIRHVLRSLELVRRTAIEAVKRDGADLYALSARAFNIDEPGGLDHHIRLGDYLTGWSNALGKSPLEALAQGERDDVFRELAQRAGFEPDSVDVIEIDKKLQSEASQIDGESTLVPPHLAYCNHYATGEGVTAFIAVGGTEACAMDAFNQHTPDYFHRDIKVGVLNEDAHPDTARMLRWIPQAALELIAKNPFGTTYYYAKLHFNLA